MFHRNLRNNDRYGWSLLSTFTTNHFFQFKALRQKFLRSFCKLTAKTKIDMNKAMKDYYEHKEGKQLLNGVSSFSTASEYDLNALENYLGTVVGITPERIFPRNKSLIWLRIDIYNFPKLIIATAPNWAFLEEETDRKDIFFFDRGVVVCWGKFNKELEKELLSDLSGFEIQPQSEITRSWMPVELTDSISSIDSLSPIIKLNRKSHSDKLAYSYGLARSIKLLYLEMISRDLLNLVGEIPSLMIQKKQSPLLTNNLSVYGAIANSVHWKHQLSVALTALQPPGTTSTTDASEKRDDDVDLRSFEITCKAGPIDRGN
eukprot:TRINITY_DN951_c0_g1_i2.p1 TRINITY_DN951_c0_g1~~TRINITY_DN951_c0_g1_i2.p1  ORF type:complete len:317 (-),score=37.44 TRINITY_DN951_c0_g1_i2:272-1222(-)